MMTNQLKSLNSSLMKFLKIADSSDVKPSTSKNIRFLAILGTLSLALSSCEGTETDTTTTTTTEAVGSGNGATFDATDFFVNVLPDTGVTLYTHLEGDWTAPCKATASQVDQDLRCIVEVEELDLYLLGFTINYNFPWPTCSYAEIKPYYYYRYEPGIGPLTVDMDFDPSDGSYTITGTAGATNATASLNGATLTCDKDYSQTITPAGPNCCAGTYFTSIRDISTGITTYGSGSWGGELSNCLVGPAVDTQPKSTANYPVSTVTYLRGTTLNSSYTVNSPNSKGYFSNVYAANYFSAAPTYDLLSAPVPIQGPGGIIPSTQPWYEFTCRDHASEIVHRIYLLVRPWSVDSEFALQSSGTFDLSGTQGAPFSDHSLLSFPGWSPGFAGTYAPYPGIEN